MCFSCICLFVCFVCVSFCHFSLPLGVGGWLRFVIMALPGLFNYLLIIIIIIIIIISLFQEDNIFGTNASLTYGPRLQR